MGAIELVSLACYRLLRHLDSPSVASGMLGSRRKAGNPSLLPHTRTGSSAGFRFREAKSVIADDGIAGDRICPAPLVKSNRPADHVLGGLNRRLGSACS